ncbi:MAG: hypothetical protein HQM08_23210, partial [Candidatus Riflebacteria bacterium]|nr:hypothetical protein [Candidatus Riflebacteria bacterium]
MGSGITQGIGLTQDIDWLGAIIELDPKKVDWNPTMGFILNPDKIQDWAVNMSNARHFFVKGDLPDWASWLDYTNALKDKLNDDLGGLTGGLVSDGITVDHDGIYVMVAFSGCPFGPTSGVFSSVWGNTWQFVLWEWALVSNIVEIACDVSNAAMDIKAAMTPGFKPPIDFKKMLTLVQGAVFSASFGTNQQQNLVPFVSFFVGEALDAATGLYKDLLAIVAAGSSIIFGKQDLLSKLADLGGIVANLVIDSGHALVDFGIDSCSITKRLEDMCGGTYPREYAFIAVGKPFSDFYPTTGGPVISSLEPTSMIAQDASQALMIHGS